MPTVQMLTDKQRRFVDEYLVDLNASQAAIRAGYSPGSASVTGCRLLANDNVARVLAELQKDASRRLELSADRVLQEMGRLAFANVSDFFKPDDEGNLQFDESAVADPVKAAAISQIETHLKPDGTRTVKFKLADKRAALSDLARHLGINGQYSEDRSVDDTRFKSNRELAIAILNIMCDAKRVVDKNVLQIDHDR